MAKAQAGGASSGGASEGESPTGESPEKKQRRGFASMDPKLQRKIASRGGIAAHEKGTAHEWTAKEAREAGRMGGQASRGGRGKLVLPPSADRSQD